MPVLRRELQDPRGGADGNPFNKGSKEKTVCTLCGRTVSTASADAPLSIPKEVPEELMTDPDPAESDTSPLPESEADPMPLSDIVNATETLSLKIIDRFWAVGGRTRTVKVLRVPLKVGASNGPTAEPSPCARARP